MAREAPYPGQRDADLLNLGRVAKMGAPIVAIGGAGTFDGVFLTGIWNLGQPPRLRILTLDRQDRSGSRYLLSSDQVIE